MDTKERERLEKIQMMIWNHDKIIKEMILQREGLVAMLPQKPGKRRGSNTTPDLKDLLKKRRG